nr:MAG TPA: hypothetical protein [Bacteriophage sp.]
MLLMHITIADIIKETLIMLSNLNVIENRSVINYTKKL